jgi:hypothetical protein
MPLHAFHERRAATKLIRLLREENDRLKLLIVRMHWRARHTIAAGDRKLAREIDEIVDDYKRKAEDTPA